MGVECTSLPSPEYDSFDSKVPEFQSLFYLPQYLTHDLTKINLLAIKEAYDKNFMEDFQSAYYNCGYIFLTDTCNKSRKS